MITKVVVVSKSLVGVNNFSQDIRIPFFPSEVVLRQISCEETRPEDANEVKTDVTNVYTISSDLSLNQEFAVIRSNSTKCTAIRLPLNDQVNGTFSFKIRSITGSGAFSGTIALVLEFRGAT